MDFTDKTLTCVDCSAPFVFSARDQEFHVTKGFANEPKRCPNCRRARRLQRGDAAPAGAGAGAGARSQPVYSGPRAQGRPGGANTGPGRPRGRRREFGRDGADGDASRSGVRNFQSSSDTNGTYAATCMACGRATDVTGEPGNRVVFCPECYEKMTAMARS